MKKHILLWAIIVLALSACKPSPTAEPRPQVEQEQATIVPQPTPTPPPPPPTSTPLPKLDELVMAAMAGWNSDQISPDQIELTLSYYADDAVFTIVGMPPQIPGEFIGREAIQAAFESWLPLHPRLEVKIESVGGDTVTATTSYWSDPTRAMKVAPLVGKDVYLFEDGKIVSETWTLNEESQSQFASAMATATAPTPSPEGLAASIDELVGNWKGYWSDVTSVYFELKDTGAYRTYFPNGDEISKGYVTFEDGKLIYSSQASGPSVTEACKYPAVYEAYVVRQGDETIQIRFVLIGEDPCIDRNEYMNGKTLTPVKP